MLRCPGGHLVTSDAVSAERTPDGFKVTFSVSHADQSTEIAVLGKSLSAATGAALVLAQEWVYSVCRSPEPPLHLDR